MKKKYLFLGDLDSINIEIIKNSHKYLKKKVKYILIGSIIDLKKNLKLLSSSLNINQIYDPLNFENCQPNSLNIFNVENISKEKYINLLNQIKIANYLANISKLDLVTMPINKEVFKKKIKFNGMTEHLEKLNKKKTKMLMHGESFSIIPLTTHINLKDVNKFIKKSYLEKSLNEILKEIKKDLYGLKFKFIKFLCYNPHCSENNTLGLEDKIITKIINKYKEVRGPYSSDSAFKKIEKKTLFISMYHDQALIPFKILNNKGVNLTLGLNYRRLSPAHGTARDIRLKNIADTTSYVSCMNF